LTNPGRWKADFQKASTKHTKSTKFGFGMQTCGKTVFAGASLVDVLGVRKGRPHQSTRFKCRYLLLEHTPLALRTVRQKLRLTLRSTLIFRVLRVFRGPPPALFGISR